MGAQGEDVKLSSAARMVFPFSVECKAYAKFAVYDHYEQCSTNAPAYAQPLLIIKGNHKKPLAVVDAGWFVEAMGRMYNMNVELRVNEMFK